MEGSLRLKFILAERFMSVLIGRTAGYNVMDLSDNELAKTHGRSLIGGMAYVMLMSYCYVIFVSMSTWPSCRGGRAPVELTTEVWSVKDSCANRSDLGPLCFLCRCQEGLFSFEFPEKPGALMRFLEQLPPGDGY